MITAQTSDNYEVYMDDVEKQKDVVAFAEGLEGVRKVNKSDVVAKTLTSVNRLIGYVSVAIIIILLVVSVFLISNTVTMGVTVRHEEKAIMKYIGATDGFVRAPFVIEGIVIGLIGAVISIDFAVFSVWQGGYICNDEIQPVEQYCRISAGYAKFTALCFR